MVNLRETGEDRTRGGRQGGCTFFSLACTICMAAVSKP